MNLTLSKLNQLIKEEMMHETQKALDIPHGIDLKDNPEILYSAAMSFLGNNPNLGPGSQKRPEAELLMKMLTNTIQGSVQHRQMADGDSDMLHSGDVEGYVVSKGTDTSPEETERMRRDQGKLKMVKRALGDAMGGSYRKDFKYKRHTDSKREFFKSNPDYQTGTAVKITEVEKSMEYEGDDSLMELFDDATLDEGGLACGACLFEAIHEASCGCPDLVDEAVYQGKTVQLNKPTRGDVKKFKVYVNSGKKDKKGRVKAKKVNFGDKKMKIKKSNPKRRKSFRARHKCHTAKDKKTARYWSCKKW
jgi:hypothetical protein